MTGAGWDRSNVIYIWVSAEQLCQSKSDRQALTLFYFSFVRPKYTVNYQSLEAFPDTELL